MADQPLPPEDLGRAAYEAESAWLAEIMPGGSSGSWDRLDPEHREVYQRIAGAVRDAEIARLQAALEQVTAERDELGSQAALLRSRLSVAEGSHAR